MENKLYTVPIEELSQQIQGLNIPQGAVVRFSYYLKTSTQDQKIDIPKRKLPPQIAKFTKKIDKMEGLSKESLETFKENTKLFRDTFDI